ncbi:MAG: ATP-binding cassette domain-containing protein [Pseudomonadota bacterium]
MTERQTIVECRNAWKVFGQNAAEFRENPGPEASSEEFAAHGLIAGVRDVSLSIHEGETFVIMGLSGSGKSTLLRCMTGLHDLSHGHVLIDGTDLATIREKDLVSLRRKMMSMVFQDFALLPHLTVFGNVEFPLRVQGADKTKRQDAARKMISLVGLEGRERYYPDELSGGQQQRVGIARSLTTDPRIWFLDEPFSALDPLIRQDMQSELLRLQALLKKTIVFITHDFDEAVRLADRLAIMKDGKIIQLGTPEDFILNPADDYVSDFARNIPKEHVLRVQSIMQPKNGDMDGAEVQADAKIADVAEAVLSSDGRHPVIDQDGTIVGSVHRRDLIPYVL